MPYFVYKIHSRREFELVERFDAYRDARNLARQMRSELGSDDAYNIKLMFAKNPEEAERLMAEEREPRPMGEDA